MLSQVPYEALEVNPLRKTEIKFSSDYRKVPIVHLGDEQVKGQTFASQVVE